MHRYKGIIAAFIFVTFTLTACAEEKKVENPLLQIEAPTFDVSKLSWGLQYVPVKIINRGDYTKYMSVVSNVECRGRNLSPKRKVTANRAVFSGDTMNVDAKFLVPGNYGEIYVELKVYDVIDTLDELMDYQIVFQKSGTFKVNAPKEIQASLKKGVTMPPLVGRHIDFDNDFSRLLPYLLVEGLSITEIAKKAGTTVQFVNDEIDYMSTRGYCKREGGRIMLGITPLKEDEATEEKQLALTAADKLATKLAENINTYWDEIDSLVKSGQLTTDSNTFFDGAAVAYRPYPTIAALSLWFDLGSSFVMGKAPLLLFNNSDLCNAYMPLFMYMVEGDTTNNGHQYFAFIGGKEGFQVYYGDTIPKIVCPEDFMVADFLSQQVVWEYYQAYFPESFMIDTAQVRPVLNHVRKGADPILEETFEKLAASAKKHDKFPVSLGHRYWFWNIVASRTLDLLVERKVLKRRLNGQFRFDGMELR